MSNEKRQGTEVILRSLTSDDFQAKLKTSLPANINVDRFTRIAITSIQQNPAILKGDRNSLYLAVLACAQAGLEPDGKQAALVLFGDKVQFMPMVAGLIMRLADCGISCDTQVVHLNDDFDVEYGDNPKITHKPAHLGCDRGEMIGAYAILKSKDGTIYREVMDAKQIEAVRNQSRAKNSLMWTQFASEAWRKTVLRRCAKRIAIPLDQRAESAIEADNATFDMGQESPTPVDDPRVVSEQTTQDREPDKSVSAPATETKDDQQKKDNVVQARPRGLQEVLEHRGKADQIF